MLRPLSIVGGFAFLLLTACGVVTYPGQPGVTTNSYAKVDMEMLEEPGLFVYEVVYDNSPGGQGVGAIVTKMYAGAKTYTSNVRTNADGTVYRTKAQYKGASVEMISIPALNQVYVAPDSPVQFLVGYDLSLDEVDDRNLAEEGIFAGSARPSEGRWARVKKSLQWIAAGTLTRSGRLGYQVQKVQLGDKVFEPTSPITVETSLTQNSVLSNLTPDLKKEAAGFLEANYPKGYRGKIVFHLSNNKTLELSATVHTLKTAEAAGTKVIHNLSPQRAAQLVQQFAQQP